MTSFPSESVEMTLPRSMATGLGSVRYSIDSSGSGRRSVFLRSQAVPIGRIAIDASGFMGV